MATPARTHRFRDMTGATPADYEADKEDMRRWLDSPDGIAACERAVAALKRMHQRIFDETGGLGLPDEWIQEALDEADDH